MSVEKFMNFMKNVNGGQPLHREDLGDEASSEQSVMGGMSGASLQLAPQLQKSLTRDIKPTAAPRAAPPSMGMGMGGGGGGGGGMFTRGGGSSTPPSNRNPRDDD
jgi:uncharacterized membrane protein YgcG